MPFTINRIVAAQLVAMVLAVLAAFHVALPSTINATSLVAVIMLGSAAVISVLRVYHPGDPLAAAKPLLSSKTIWTQIEAALFAVLALAGRGIGVDQAGVVDTVMTVLGFAGMFFGGTASAPIAASSATVRSPAIVAIAAFGLTAMAMLSSCGQLHLSAGTTTTVVSASYDAAGSADLAYMAAHSAGVQAVRQGKLSADVFQELDERAYGALLTVRQLTAGVRSGVTSQADLTAAGDALTAAITAITAGEK